MFKFFTLCFLAVFAVVAAKPGVITPLAYSAAPLVASSYVVGAPAYAASYASPYVAAASPYVASSYPYAAYSYSAYPSYAGAQVLVR